MIFASRDYRIHRRKTADINYQLKTLKGEARTAYLEREQRREAEQREETYEEWLDKRKSATPPPAPFSVKATAAAGPEDYVRVAAFLTDGSTIDDVILMASPAAMDEIAVNLVDLHVVVSDGNGHPVGDLRPGDFTVFEFWLAKLWLIVGFYAIAIFFFLRLETVE